MRIEPEISSAAIVLRGKLNPAIFQPFWFVRHELIPESAGDAATVNMIHPQISDFSIAGQFALHVDINAFSISRDEAPLIVIADLVARIFGDLLPHTPLGQLGINRVVHFNVGSEAERDRIGHELAPLGPWGAWGQAISKSKVRGGLMSLSMIENGLDDREHGYVRATIEPSRSIGGGRTGIFMMINDHFQLAIPDAAPDASAMTKIVIEKFDSSLKRSEEIIDTIMSLKS